YKASRQQNACRNTRLPPIGWNLAGRSDTGDAAAPDHHGSATMPAATVKNTVRNDGALFDVSLVLAHIFPRGSDRSCCKFSINQTRIHRASQGAVMSTSLVV